MRTEFLWSLAVCESLNILHNAATRPKSPYEHQGLEHGLDVAVRGPPEWNE